MKSIKYAETIENQGLEALDNLRNSSLPKIFNTSHDRVVLHDIRLYFGIPSIIINIILFVLKVQPNTTYKLFARKKKQTEVQRKKCNS